MTWPIHLRLGEEEERMVRYLRRLLGVGAALVLMPGWASAQEAATITGTVRSDAGQPLQLATVFVEGLGIGTTTRENGEYTLTVPAARVQGQAVTLSSLVWDEVLSRQSGTAPHHVPGVVPGAALPSTRARPSCSCGGPARRSSARPPSSSSRSLRPCSRRRTPCP